MLHGYNVVGLHANSRFCVCRTKCAALLRLKYSVSHEFRCYSPQLSNLLSVAQSWQSPNHALTPLSMVGSVVWWPVRSLALKHKHLEVITVFVSGKDLFMVDSQLGSGNSLWYGYLPIVFDLLLGKERVIFCGTCSVNNLK